MAANWYYSKGDQQFGPISAADLKELAKTGQLQPTDQVWKGGMEKSVPAKKVNGLFTATESPSTHASVEHPVDQRSNSPPAVSATPPDVPSTNTASSSSANDSVEPTASESLAYEQSDANLGKCALCGRQDKGKEITYSIGTKTGETYFNQVKNDAFETFRFHDSSPVWVCNQCMWRDAMFGKSILGCTLTLLWLIPTAFVVTTVNEKVQMPSTAWMAGVLALSPAVVFWWRHLKQRSRVPRDMNTHITEPLLDSIETKVLIKTPKKDGTMSSCSTLFGLSDPKEVPDKIAVTHLQAKEIEKEQASLVERSKALEASYLENPMSFFTMTTENIELANYLLEKGLVGEGGRRFAKSIGSIVGSDETTVTDTKVLDFCSDEEKEIERDARAGKSLGHEVDTLIEELIAIGRSDGFISEPDGEKFDESHRHVRACEIGTILNDNGGKQLMIAVAYRVHFALGESRPLEVCWGGIGEWLA